MYVYLGAEHKYDFYLNPNVNSLNYYYNTISDKVIKIHINLELLSLAMSFYSWNLFLEILNSKIGCSVSSVACTIFS